MSDVQPKRSELHRRDGSLCQIHYEIMIGDRKITHRDNGPAFMVSMPDEGTFYWVQKGAGAGHYSTKYGWFRYDESKKGLVKHDWEKISLSDVFKRKGHVIDEEILSVLPKDFSVDDIPTQEWKPFGQRKQV